MNYSTTTGQTHSNRKIEGSGEISRRLTKIRGLAEALLQVASTGLSRQEAVQSAGSQPAADFESKVRGYEIKLITEALIKTRGRQNRAAKLLGIKSSTLNAKIKRYNIPIGNITTLQLRNGAERGNR